MNSNLKPVNEEYEELLFPLFLNAANKLMAAMYLYKAGIFYDSAFVLTVVAEEELAKTILIPIALETDSLDGLFSKRDGVYFHHKKKQKLASLLTLFEKDGSKTEARKQAALYERSGKPRSSAAGMQSWRPQGA